MSKRDEDYCPCEGHGILVSEKCSLGECIHSHPVYGSTFGDCPSWPCNCECGRRVAAERAGGAS